MVVVQLIFSCTCSGACSTIFKKSFLSNVFTNIDFYELHLSLTTKFEMM